MADRKRRYNISTEDSDFSTENIAAYIANAQDIPYTDRRRDICFDGHDVWNKQDVQFSVHKNNGEFEVISQKVSIPVKPIIRLKDALKRGQLDL